jgi:hypothetical protein
LTKAGSEGKVRPLRLRTFFTVIRHAGRHFLWKRVHRLYRKSEKLFERKVSEPLDDLAYRVGMAA